MKIHINLKVMDPHPHTHKKSIDKKKDDEKKTTLNSNHSQTKINAYS